MRLSNSGSRSQKKTKPIKFYNYENRVTEKSTCASRLAFAITLHGWRNDGRCYEFLLPQIPDKTFGVRSRAGRQVENNPPADHKEK